MNAGAALFCVSLAAIAAGLTLGLLGLDPLVLLIKNRAGETEAERHMAGGLLPIVERHHRLLVTLLLMNSIANEALPIFLEKLVPSSVAIVLSVTLVLFFGEIIPSAVFTGPNQLKIASRLIPLVQFFLLVLSPIAVPIAKLLDCLLHDDEEECAYKRGELSALVRIQYEERLAAKRKRRAERHEAEILHAKKINKKLSDTGAIIDGPIDICDVVQSHRASVLAQEIKDAAKAVKSHIVHVHEAPTAPPTDANNPLIGQSLRFDRHSFASSEYSGGDSIHPDEVMIVEGALQMKTKLSVDIMRPKRLVYRLPSDMILNERSVVKIYASGFSRIPVYAAKKGRDAIVGILITKQLIVVSPDDARPLNTLPLYCPVIVGPAVPLVNLLNMMQSGGGGQKGGHMALVCADPKLAREAIDKGEPLPKEAGWMGILTLEDIIETLLQEEIYDEYDKTHKLGALVWTMWLRYKIRKRRKIRKATVEAANAGKLAEEGRAPAPAPPASETTALLKGGTGTG